jgi:hypothetical protein
MLPLTGLPAALSAAEIDRAERRLGFRAASAAGRGVPATTLTAI